MAMAMAMMVMVMKMMMGRQNRDLGSAGLLALGRPGRTAGTVKTAPSSAGST